ncbi:MAG: hypothetical protein JNK42_01850 [Caedimonas sp.]|nr:hypothetical protein [Caedimonas sp.]
MHKLYLAGAFVVISFAFQGMEGLDVGHRMSEFLFVRRVTLPLGIIQA